MAKPIEVEEEKLHQDEELIEKLEGQRVFRPRSWEDWLVAIIAFTWSLYQIYVVIVPVNSVFIRATHLAFALVLAYLMYPMFQSKKLRQTIPWWDFLLAAIAAIGALYIFWNYDALNARSGDWNQLDIFMGVMSIILLIEGSRRVLGLALGIIAIIFLVYDHWGQIMPDLIEAGIAGINPLEVKAGMDIFDLKKRYGDAITLIGGIDVRNWQLRAGSPVQHTPE